MTTRENRPPFWVGSAFLFLLFFFSFPALAPAAKPADYLTRLRRAVAEWRREIPALDQSAAQATARLVGGGRLYIAGTQLSFIEEALGRSGGLIAAQSLGSADQLQAGDVVLFGAIRGGDPAILEALHRRVKAAGAQLVLFSSSVRVDGVPAFPVCPVADAATPAVESTSNVAGMWAWSGQLISQCIARGKTPCVFESMFMPGAMVRDTMLRPHPFHVGSLPAGPNFPALGRDYLRGLDAALARVAEKNAAAFRQAKILLAQIHAAGRSVTIYYLGHMFPNEFASNPMPSWIAPAPPQASQTAPSGSTLALDLGYQWFPWEVPALSGPGRIASIIVTSRPPTPDWRPDATHIYIDPCWEVQDATVQIPGYDVKALPASGVLESAIFWELLSP